MKETVSIVRCEAYDAKEVLKGLKGSIELIGGIETLVKRGNRVLLKPNLLQGKPPEKAVTTHPSILKGMIEIVREAGGIPFVGDSPGIGSAARAAEKAGIKAVTDQAGCMLVEFDSPVLPGRNNARFFRQVEIDRTVLEADVVINLPKWKTHGMTGLTLAVKNLFGCVPGPRKALWHLKAGEDRVLFARMLVDICRTVRPSLTVLDGIVGMEGNGPSSGRPIPLGLLLASRDPFSIDQIVCDLLNIPRRSLLTNQIALEEGIARDEIDVVGLSVNEAKVTQFQLPPSAGMTWGLPGFLRKALKNALASKPFLEEALCVSCDRCVEVCPPKALSRKKGKLSFDLSSCIRCFCCQELCPEGAISIKPGWAANMIKKEVRRK